MQLLSLRSAQQLRKVWASDSRKPQMCSDSLEIPYSFPRKTHRGYDRIRISPGWSQSSQSPDRGLQRSRSGSSPTRHEVSVTIRTGEGLKHLNNRSCSGPYKCGNIRVMLNCNIHDGAILVDMLQNVVHLLRMLSVAIQLCLYIFNVSSCCCCCGPQVRCPVKLFQFLVT